MEFLCGLIAGVLQHSCSLLPKIGLIQAVKSFFRIFSKLFRVMKTFRFPGTGGAASSSPD